MNGWNRITPSFIDNVIEEDLEKYPADQLERCYFEDGIRHIDFILAYEVDNNRDHTKRSRFHYFLIQSGFDLEVSSFVDTNYKVIDFLKIHAPEEVLLTYADTYSLNLPVIENDIEISQQLSHHIWDERHRRDHFKGFKTLWNLRLLFENTDIRNPTPFFKLPFSLRRRSQFYLDGTEIIKFSEIQKIWIVWEMLRKAGIYTLLNEKVYTAAFPLHDGPLDVEPDDPTVPLSLLATQRMTLYESWSNPVHWYKYQPLNYIQQYFGDQIAIYFAFLGFHTRMLIIPTIIGLITFLFGLSSQNSLDRVSREVCEVSNQGNTIMCPSCDQQCEYQFLKNNCIYSKLTYIFNNSVTILLAISGAIWSNAFMTLWERQEQAHSFHWDMENYEKSEQVRPEFELTRKRKYKVNKITQDIEPYATWFQLIRSFVASFSVVLLCLTLVCGTTLGVITYRIVVTQVWSGDQEPLINEYAKLIASMSGSLINLIIMIILDSIYSWLALKLTTWENHRTATEHQKSVTVKLFLFQITNYTSAIFYIAFIKGQLTGRPGAYYRIFGLRAEQCDYSGCFIELTILCSVVLLGKNVWLLVYEIVAYPLVIAPFKQLKNKNFCGGLGVIKSRMSRCFAVIRRRMKIESRNPYERPERQQPMTRWEKDYKLEPIPEHGLLDEYLEVVIQYAMVSLFMAAFPLGPLVALITNLFKVQVDSNKVLQRYRRPHHVRARGIGIWTSIMKGICYLAIITNACIIALTGDAMERLLYAITHCGHTTANCTNSSVFDQRRSWNEYFQRPAHALEGFVEYSLSTFNVEDFEKASIPSHDGRHSVSEIVEQCRYRGFYHGPDAEQPYTYTKEFWHLLAIKLAFILVFEQAVTVIAAGISALVDIWDKNIKIQKARASHLAGAAQEIEKERVWRRQKKEKRDTLRKLNVVSGPPVDKTRYSSSERKFSNIDV